MSRETISLPVPDASAFAKNLRASLHARSQTAKPALPSHVELLNLLAHAAGFRNFQTLKALRVQAAAIVDASPAAAYAADKANSADTQLSETARKALLQFDAQGRLVRLPVKYSVQQMVMWALWLHMPARRAMREREVNDVLKAFNTFGDHVTLRRELINMRLMTRKPDCSEYHKLTARPSSEVVLFLREYRRKLKAGDG
jgi:hypothetical protein